MNIETAIDKKYDFLDTWGIPIRWLELNFQDSVVIGPGCQKQVTIIPLGEDTAASLLEVLTWKLSSIFGEKKE